jgi:dsDNA-specific endonuclease/ATPase MutS2
MHQCGLQIPVARGSEIPVFTKVLTDIGDGQSMQNSLSTFSGHMSAIADMLNQANKKTLILIDEIGTGTDPLDGASLGISILEALYEKGAYTLVSTHYGEIKDYSEKRRFFENAAMDFDRETLAPKYKLRMGVSGESNAYWIVKELGISDKIINRAKKVAKVGLDALITDKDMPRDDYHTSRRAYLKERQAQATKTIEEEEKTAVEEQMTTISFGQGDRVKSTSLSTEVLVYSTDEFTGKVTVFHDNQMIEVDADDLTLVFSAETLYPVGYNMDQLFRTFKDRKLEKDIDKGRFKNLQELKDRMVFNEKHPKKKY